MKDKKIIVGGRSKSGVANCIHVLITLNQRPSTRLSATDYARGLDNMSK